LKTASKKIWFKLKIIYFCELNATLARAQSGGLRDYPLLSQAKVNKKDQLFKFLADFVRTTTSKCYWSCKPFPWRHNNFYFAAQPPL